MIEQENKPINITPEKKAEELAEWFLMDANNDYEKARACIYAAKVAWEIQRTHNWTSFEANFYLSVENILKKKAKSF